MDSIPMIVTCCLRQGCNDAPALTDAEWEKRMERSVLAAWALNLPTVTVVKDLAEKTRGQ